MVDIPFEGSLDEVTVRGIDLGLRERQDGESLQAARQRLGAYRQRVVARRTRQHEHAGPGLTIQSGLDRVQQRRHPLILVDEDGRDLADHCRRAVLRELEVVVSVKVDDGHT
nr:hypothetical protein [Cellulomonas sp. PhB143]